MEELYAEMVQMSEDLAYQYNEELTMWELKEILAREPVIEEED
jgi:hypothetical protein